MGTCSSSSTPHGVPSAVTTTLPYRSAHFTEPVKLLAFEQIADPRDSYCFRGGNFARLGNAEPRKFNDSRLHCLGEASRTRSFGSVLEPR